MSATSDAYDFFVTVIFAIVALMLLFPSNTLLPIDRRLATIWGSVLCTLVAYCFKNSVNTLDFIDVDVLIVLVAIMAINYLLLRHPWLSWGIERMQWYIRHDVDKGFYVVSIMSFFISQVIMNDGLCLMLVHPVLDAFVHMRPTSSDSSYDPKHHIYDPFYFMLNIACSANIGSVMTFAGNPQNLIIAQFLSKYMNCAVFYIYMLLPAVVTWVLTVGLINYLRKQAIRALQEGRESIAFVEGTEMVPIVGSTKDPKIFASPHSSKKHSSEGSKDIALSELEDSASPDEEVSPLNEGSHADDYYDNNTGEMENTRFSPIHSTTTNDSHNNSETIQKKKKKKTKKETKKYSSLEQLSSSQEMIATNQPEEEDNDEDTLDRDEETGEMHTTATNHSRNDSNQAVIDDHRFKLTFRNLVFPLMLLPLIILEFVGIISLTGLFIFSAVSMVCIVILVEYYVSNRSTSEQITHKIHEITHFIEELFKDLDYNLLIIFTGLFIVSGSFLQTGVPSFFWNLMAGKTPFQTGISIFVISIYIIVFSQLVGNVPLVYLARDEVQALDRNPQIFGWLILAYVSTIAGNFTLVGSAANIIVVEKAMRHGKKPVKINAKEHFKICGAVTLLSITLGVLILSFEVYLFG